MAIEYRNCTYRTIESPNENTIGSGETHCLDHLASGVEIHNHDCLDIVSKSQISKHTGTSKQDCDSKHAAVQLQ
jgi:S-ribosylhomocysteine lyase LuxS involved in autoinducer biosynthesis